MLTFLHKKRALLARAVGPFPRARDALSAR